MKTKRRKYLHFECFGFSWFIYGRIHSCSSIHCPHEKIVNCLFTFPILYTFYHAKNKCPKPNPNIGFKQDELLSVFTIFFFSCFSSFFRRSMFYKWLFFFFHKFHSWRISTYYYMNSVFILWNKLWLYLLSSSAGLGLFIPFA